MMIHFFKHLTVIFSLSFVGFICTVPHEVASEICVYEKIITRVKLSNILTMVLQEKAYSVSGCDLFSKQS